MRKLEYQLNFTYDFRVQGEVPYSIILKTLHSQDYSSLDFQINLSGGAHVY